MENLLELIEVTDKDLLVALLRKGRKARTVPTKLEQLYSILEKRKGEVREEKIVARLYDGKKDKNYPGYRKLKSRLRNLLFDVNVIGDFKTIYSNDYDDAYVKGNKAIALINILVLKRKYKLAYYIAKKTFGKIEPFQIIHLNAVLALKLLNLELICGEGKGGRYKYYKSLCEYYNLAEFEERNLLIKSINLSESINRHNFKSNALSSQAAMDADSSYYMLRKYPDVSLIQFTYYKLRIFQYVYSKQYNKALQFANMGIAAITRCKGASTFSYQSLLLESIDCSVYTKNFVDGKDKINKFLSDFKGYSANFFKVKELAIRLGLVSKEYGYAMFYLSSINWKLLEKVLPQIHHEYWRILEAFVHLLVATGQVEPVEDLPKLRPFRLNRFLNSIPNYEKNKHGLYVQVLILQMMFLMARGEYDKVVDRVEGFDRFRRRYLKGKQEFRNNCFYRLILKVVDANFNRVAAERLGKPILEKMINSPELEHREISDIEWIPYEDLWEILLGTLDNKRRMRAAKRTA